MFIDDNTSATNKFHEWLHVKPTPENVVSHLQKDAQVWERLLFTSGGLLKLRKCLYYDIHWQFDDEGRPSLTSKTAIPSLSLTNSRDTIAKEINQFDCSVAHQYLGVWNAPSLSMTVNLQALTQKAKSYSSRLFKSGLSKYEVWMAYFACFVPAMTFTLAVCSFSLSTLVKLQQNAVRSTLARLGINCNISRGIVFGSPLFGGLGLRHLFVEQGITQLELLLRHLRAKTTQGALLLIGLSWWHLSAGFSTSLWKNTDANISYVEHSWYTSLKDFLSFVNGSVYIPPKEFIPWTLLRHDDACIMERISTLLPGAARADLKAFNRCRLYLGVFFLSEITMADGVSLDRLAWKGTRERFSPYLWPFQPYPGPHSNPTQAPSHGASGAAS
jgi:hypothetical protein